MKQKKDAILRAINAAGWHDDRPYSFKIYTILEGGKYTTLKVASGMSFFNKRVLEEWIRGFRGGLTFDMDYTEVRGSYNEHLYENDQDYIEPELPSMINNFHKTKDEFVEFFIACGLLQSNTVTFKRMDHSRYDTFRLSQQFRTNVMLYGDLDLSTDIVHTALNSWESWSDAPPIIVFKSVFLTDGYPIYTRFSARYLDWTFFWVAHDDRLIAVHSQILNQQDIDSLNSQLALHRAERGGANEFLQRMGITMPQRVSKGTWVFDFRRAPPS